MAADATPHPAQVADRATRAARDAALAVALAHAAAGDALAFERFYNATVGYARALARRIVHGADLEDALADAYLDAWRLAPRFDPARGSAVSWLLNIVHSRALDICRRRHAGCDELQTPEADSADPGPGDRLWQREAGRRLNQALAALSANERWVLGLAYFRDQTQQAIADTTGLPLGTVKSLILRAQGKLRQALCDLP
jgi:RNA polymerase sigma-70 factor (ECF subfamily)